jgi:FkbM family methyltransferase
MRPGEMEAEIERLLEAAGKASAQGARGGARDAAEREPFVVYGAGGRGREVRRVLEARGHRVLGFVDRAAQGKPPYVVEGLPVWAPEDPAALRASEGARVVVGIFRYDADVAEIVASLEARGFREVCTFLDVYQRYPEDFASTYWLGPVSAIPAHADAIRRASRRLGGDASRRVFVDCLRMRVEADVRALRAPDRAAQYVPRDVVAFDRPLRFVDGGAFDGDTVRALRAAKVPLEAVAAFEPDPTNYAALARSAAEAAAAGAGGDVDWTLFPCGLWSSATQLRFDATANDGARIGGSGGTVIQCVALDEALPSFRPTLLKLDVEGAEPDALEGAKRTIARSRPTLAISAYHLPDHLWSLLAKIDAWELGYRFELRHHGFLDFDVVLYALPAA